MRGFDDAVRYVVGTLFGTAVPHGIENGAGVLKYWFYHDLNSVAITTRFRVPGRHFLLENLAARCWVRCLA